MFPARVTGSFLVVLSVAALTPASGQARVDERTPYLLVTALVTGDRALGPQIAEAVRVRIRHLVPQRELYVISRDAINSTLETEPPSHGGWEIDDVREIAKELRANVILEIGATRLPKGVHLEPVLIRSRNGTPEQLDPIDAPTVGRAALLLAKRIVADSSLRRSHELPPRKPAKER